MLPYQQEVEIDLLFQKDIYIYIYVRCSRDRVERLMLESNVFNFNR